AVLLGDAAQRVARADHVHGAPGRGLFHGARAALGGGLRLGRRLLRGGRGRPGNGVTRAPMSEEGAGGEQGPPDGLPAPRTRHESNSAYRTSKEVYRPVGGRHATDSDSTCASGGPLWRSRASSSITSRPPSTRTRTLPSFRFIT